DLVLEHQMDVTAGHLPFVRRGGRDTESLHSLEQAGLDEVDGLQGTIRLLGDNQRDILQRAFVFAERTLAKIGQYEPGACGHGRYQQHTAQEEQSDGAETPAIAAGQATCNEHGSRPLELGARAGNTAALQTR